MDAHGMNGHVPMPRTVAIWKSLSGLIWMDAHGTHGHVSMPLGGAIWKSYSGHERIDAHGMNGHVHVQHKLAIWKSLSGHARMNAHGRMSQLGRGQQTATIPKSFCGCAPIDAHHGMNNSWTLLITKPAKPNKNTHTTNEKITQFFILWVSQTSLL